MMSYLYLLQRVFAGSIPLDLPTFRARVAEHRITVMESLPYPKTFSWVLAHPVAFDEPPQGAVIWVNGVLEHQPISRSI